MLRNVIVIFLVLWLLGIIFKIAVALAWILLIIAVVMAVYSFITRESTQA